MNLKHILLKPSVLQMYFIEAEDEDDDDISPDNLGDNEDYVAEKRLAWSCLDAFYISLSL